LEKKFLCLGRVFPVAGRREKKQSRGGKRFLRWFKRGFPKIPRRGKTRSFLFFFSFLAHPLEFEIMRFFGPFNFLFVVLVTRDQKVVFACLFGYFGRPGRPIWRAPKYWGHIGDWVGIGWGEIFLGGGTL